MAREKYGKITRELDAYHSDQKILGFIEKEKRANNFWTFGFLQSFLGIMLGISSFSGIFHQPRYIEKD